MSLLHPSVPSVSTGLWVSAGDGDRLLIQSLHQPGRTDARYVERGGGWYLIMSGWEDGEKWQRRKPGCVFEDRMHSERY